MCWKLLQTCGVLLHRLFDFEGSGVWTYHWWIFLTGHKAWESIWISCFPYNSSPLQRCFLPPKNRMIFTVADFDSSSAVFEALLCHVERAADCSAMAVDPPSDFHGLVPEPAPCRASRASRASRARRRAVVPLDIDAHGKVMTRVKGQRTSEEPNKVPTRFFWSMSIWIWLYRSFKPYT